MPCTYTAPLARRAIRRQGRLISKPAMADHPTPHLTVVEINGAVAQHLRRLMPLARQEYNVAGPRLVERDFNGALAVRLDEKLCLGALQADNCVVDDEKRVFTAWIVG